MTYSALTKDYPRYPSVFECEPTEAERDMLMVQQAVYVLYIASKDNCVLYYISCRMCLT